MKQLNEQEAKALYESKEWESWDDKTLATFQLLQDKLCVDFSRFHAAIEKTLGRPVYTHEFGLNRDGLIKELLGEKPAPTLKEIIEMIPEEKRIIMLRRISR